MKTWHYMAIGIVVLVLIFWVYKRAQTAKVGTTTNAVTGQTKDVKTDKIDPKTGKPYTLSDKIDSLVK